MLTLSRQKAKFGKSIFDEFQSRMYGLSDCASKYDEGELEESKLEMELLVNSYSCDYLLRKIKLLTDEPMYTKPAQPSSPECRVNLNALNNKLAYTWVQSFPSSSWTIIHTLCYIPNVLIVDTNGVEIKGAITFESKNKIIINFSEAVEGTAYLS